MKKPKNSEQASDQAAIAGNLKQGDRIITPTGRTGEVLIPEGNETMPRHCLVKFDDNSDLKWLLAQILTKAPR